MNRATMRLIWAAVLLFVGALNLALAFRHRSDDPWNNLGAGLLCTTCAGLSFAEACQLARKAK